MAKIFDSVPCFEICQAACCAKTFGLFVGFYWNHCRSRKGMREVKGLTSQRWSAEAPWRLLLKSVVFTPGRRYLVQICWAFSQQHPEHLIYCTWKNVVSTRSPTVHCMIDSGTKGHLSWTRGYCRARVRMLSCFFARFGFVFRSILEHQYHVGTISCGLVVCS